MSSNPKLPVIFRAERSGPFKGDVTAVFPTLPADYAGLQMTCYAHIGQHSGCSFGWYVETRAAHPHEYAALLAELRGIYSREDDEEAVELVVYQRRNEHHRKAYDEAHAADRKARA